MPSPLPPLIGVLRGDTSHFSAGMSKATGEARAMSSSSSAAFSGLAGIGKVAFLGIAGAALIGGAASVKMAGDFQQSMTQLVTGAGESRANIGLVSQGILSMAGQVGASAQDIVKAIYPIESVGYKGAAGLTVMRAAAEGAKVGGADLTVTANALAGAMYGFKVPANQATQVMSEMVAAVGAGNLHMEDLASVMGTIGPVAAVLHVKFSEVTAALATMTSSGIPAADAATYLKMTMLQLEHPSGKAVAAFKAVGLGSHQLADDLGKKGLAATLQEATDAISKKFAPGSAEYIAHLADMVGGTKSMMAALALTGPNMSVFQANIKTVSGAAHKAGGDVAGWGETTKDLNFQVDQAKAAVGAMGIQIGLVLIPFVEKGIVVGTQFVNYLMKNKDVALEIGAAIGGPVAVAIGIYTVSMIGAAVATLALIWPVLAIMAAVALLSAGVIYAYNHWGWFRNAVNAAGTDLKAFVGWLGKEVPPIWAGFTKDVSAAWAGLKDFGTWISNTFGPILNAMGGALKTAGSFLNSINPWAKHSPSLVENVLSGTTAIAGHYAHMASAVRSSVAGIIPSPGIGVSSSAGSSGSGSSGSSQSMAGAPTDMSETNQLLRALIAAVTAPPTGQTGVAAALYKAMQGANMNRLRGMAGA